jgi:hypothetical protein
VTQRVADEVGEDNVEAAAVHPCRQSRGDVSADTGPASRSQALADGVRDICFIGDKLHGAGIEAGDLNEVFDEPVEVLNLLSDQPRGRRGVSGQPRVLVQDADYRRHRGQRSPQLVGHVAGELPGPCFHLFQVAHLVLQCGGHLVE